MQLFKIFCLAMLSVALSVSCNKKEFIKKMIFLEEFNDNSKGWYSNPDTNILHSSSECIKIENGQLKMHFERGLGISNCGGGWLEIKLSDSSLNHSAYFGRIGLRIKVNQGYLQRLSLIDSIVDNSTYGHTLRDSYFHFRCGKHLITFPLGDMNTSIIDLNKNFYSGSEFVFISNTNWNENKIYIDGQEIQYTGNTFWFETGNNTFDFEFKFNIGYGQELIPHEIDLFIESIEIFTWEGDFCIDGV